MRPFDVFGVKKGGKSRRGEGDSEPDGEEDYLWSGMSLYGSDYSISCLWMQMTMMVLITWTENEVFCEILVLGKTARR